MFKNNFLLFFVILFAVMMKSSFAQNMISNGDFSSGNSNWSTGIENIAKANFSFENAECFIDIEAITNESWHINLMQSGITLEEGQRYTFTFDAKATANRTVEVKAQFDGDPWSSAIQEEVDITTEMGTYSVSWIQNVQTMTNKVGLFVGQDTADVWIDNIVLVEGYANGLITQYWNNVDYTGAPVLTRLDSVLQYDFGGTSVDPIVNNDGVGMQWHGQLVPNFTETYTLTLFHNDGCRLWINGNLLIDQWNDGQETHSATIDLVADQIYDLVVRIYEGEGTTRGSLSWSSASVSEEIIPKQNLFAVDVELPYMGEYGLITEFWNNVDYTGAPVLTRIDSVLQFDFGGGSGDTLINDDGVGMQWRGQIVPDFSETYTLTLFHNDGCRLWINGDLLIENWADGQTTDTTTIDMVAGQAYDLIVRIYEGSGTTRGSLSWSSASVIEEIIPNQNLRAIDVMLPVDHGLIAEFWNNVDYIGEPVFTTVDSVLQFDYGSGSVDTLVNDDGVGMQWRGQLIPDFTETYTLTLFHNDGCRLWIDGVLLINEWQDGQETHTATIDLVEDQAYDLVVQIYEGENTTRGSLSWSSASVAEEIIPNKNLYAVDIDLPKYGIVYWTQNGTITFDPPGGPYSLNTAVTITAVPDSGYEFIEWLGDIKGSTNPITILIDGNKSISAIFDLITGVDDNKEIPTEYKLSQNYPNPFNPSTAIKFQLPRSGQVTIQMYNTLGQLVEELVNKELDAGYHSLVLDASNISSGVYYYSIKAGDFVDVKKMMLLK